MRADLERLPDDEETCRQYEARHVQNVLDALNYYRCKAKSAEKELARAEGSKAEAWAGIHVRDAEINVTVKKLREELTRSEARVAALRDIGR